MYLAKESLKLDVLKWIAILSKEGLPQQKIKIMSRFVMAIHSLDSNPGRKA